MNGSNTDLNYEFHACLSIFSTTVKKVKNFPVISRDVTNQTLPGRCGSRLVPVSHARWLQINNAHYVFTFITLVITIFCSSTLQYRNFFAAVWYLNSCSEIGFPFLVILSFSKISRDGDSKKIIIHLHYIPGGAVTVTYEYTHLPAYTRQYVMYSTVLVQ